MEKFSQFRDRGTGIAPFFPIPAQPSGLQLPLHGFLFLFRLPVFIAVSVACFLFHTWLPLGSLAKKALLWMILGVPGIWWVDLQIDGVKKGSLAKHHALRLPQPSDIIAASLTSPIDPLYLAAIFDPLFTVSYPHTRQVQQISLFSAILKVLRRPREYPPPTAKLVDLQTVIESNPKRVVVVFPECTATNGKGILPFSPSLLAGPANCKIFPISLRYSPSDITTPVPGSYWKFLWNLLSRPTHCIRVRIAECAYNTPKATLSPTEKSSTSNNYLDDQQDQQSTLTSNTETLTSFGEAGAGLELSVEERRVLDKVADALARLGRVKRVGLTVRDKIAFLEAWGRHRRR